MLGTADQPCDFAHAATQGLAWRCLLPMPGRRHDAGHRGGPCTWPHVSRGGAVRRCNMFRKSEREISIIYTHTLSEAR